MSTRIPIATAILLIQSPPKGIERKKTHDAATAGPAPFIADAFGLKGKRKKKKEKEGMRDEEYKETTSSNPAIRSGKREKRKETLSALRGGDEKKGEEKMAAPGVSKGQKKLVVPAFSAYSLWRRKRRGERLYGRFMLAMRAGGKKGEGEGVDSRLRCGFSILIPGRGEKKESAPGTPIGPR